MTEYTTLQFDDITRPGIVTNFLDTPIGSWISEGDTWLAGGAVRRAITGEQMEDADYDLFFWDEARMDAVQEVAENRDRYDVVYVCDEGELVTIKDRQSLPVDMTIQLIGIDFFDSATDVIESFDFTISMAVVDGDEVLTTEQAIEDMADRTLRINKVTYPVATARRFGKYRDQGYQLDDTTIQGFVDSVFWATATGDINWSVYAID